MAQVALIAMTKITLSAESCCVSRIIASLDITANECDPLMNMFRLRSLWLSTQPPVFVFGCLSCNYAILVCLVTFRLVAYGLLLPGMFMATAG